MVQSEILVTQCANNSLYALVIASTNSLSRFICHSLSIVNCCHFHKKDAYVEEILETCILYYFSIGYYDWIVSVRSRALSKP